MQSPNQLRNIANGIERIRSAGNWAEANLKGEATEYMTMFGRVKYCPLFESGLKQYKDGLRLANIILTHYDSKSAENAPIIKTCK